jgi:hypothetical protein
VFPIALSKASSQEGARGRMAAVDNFELARWRSIPSERVLVAIAAHAKRDPAYAPIKDPRSSRWHASVGGVDFELLMTGPMFGEAWARRGGGGAIDLVMHLTGLRFEAAVQRLRDLGL